MARLQAFVIGLKPLWVALVAVQLTGTPGLPMPQSGPADASRPRLTRALVAQDGAQPPDRDEDDLLGEQDDLLGDEDDLLNEPKPADDTVVTQPAVDIAHEQVFLADRFPPATACATCHPKHYRE